MSRRFGFVTCVRLGEEVLEEILEVGGRVDAMLTLPDEVAQDKSGRIYLDEMAEAHSAELLKARNINDAHAVQWLEAQQLDWLFIIGWSQIASPQVLKAAKNGALGMHPTLLPEGRGRASIPWAILKGLDRTGVTFFKLDEGVDSGPILDQEVIPVAPDESATTLYDKVVRAHRVLIRRNWDELAGGAPAFRTQDESRATYWPGRKPEDGRIREGMSVAEVERLVRAVASPYPGALWHDGDRHFRILAGEAGDSREGKKLRLRDGTYTAVRFEEVR